MSFEIGRTLETSEPFCLSIKDIVTGRTFIASITRWGKSWTARKIVEKCYGHAGIILVDPEGEYSSLREKFAFLIIGKDIPIQLETAEFVAEKVLESKFSVIIDLSMVEDDELGKEYVNTFLAKFFFLETTVRQPYLLVVEEAEDFGPEKGIGTQTCLHTLINYVKKGGKRGIGVVFVAHRPAWVSKGILSQCSNKAMGKIESTDFDALEEYARVPKKVIETLPNLKVGEFCFVGDWTPKETFVKIGKVQTTHLGFTPDVIPIPPKNMQQIIENLKKMLPQIIQKVSPTVGSIEDTKKQIREEFETKYKDRVEAIQRTADEKAERKFKVKIDALQETNAKLSRSQALQSPAPLTDVLEHPVVMRVLTDELSDKGKDLLIKIEREPNLTRQQLAAFLTTSTDAVANLIATINRTFKAEVIIGDGKPIKYQSMLKRLFLTDVGKREIQELKRLQNQVTEQNQLLEQKQQTISHQEATINELKRSGAKVKELEDLIEKQANRLESLDQTLEKATKEKEALVKLYQQTAKPAEALIGLIKSVVDERTKNIPQTAGQATNKDEIVTIVKAEFDNFIERFTKIAEIKAKEEIAKFGIPQIPQEQLGSPGTALTLEQKVIHFDLKKPEERLTIDTTSIQGRLLFLVIKGFFDVRHNRKEIVEDGLLSYGWSNDPKEVDSALVELCQKGVFQRKISTGNTFWYTLQPEAKTLIHD